MPYDHNWSEWKSDSYDCTAGGTRTKECLNKGCGATDSETVEPGKHLNLITEGYKAPTETEEGSTGTTKCSSCGNTISEAKVISKIINATNGGTADYKDDFWALNGSQPNKLIDGNPNTGICSSSRVVRHTVEIVFLEKAFVNKTILVVNSSGSIADIGNIDTVTNNNYEIYFKLFDEAGQEIYVSEKFMTEGKQTIEVSLPAGLEAKSIQVYYYLQDYVTTVYLWEVTVLGGGEIIENEE